MKELKVAILAVGGAGAAQVTYFNRIAGCRVVKLFDIDADILKRTCDRFNIPGTQDVNEILGDDQIDIISVCVPDMFHADYCIKALDAGKHVLCEKPLAHNLADCRRIIEKVRETGLVFAVQHERRYIKWAKLAKRLLDDGDLGRVFAVEADYIHDMTKRATEIHPWRVQKETAQNVLTGGGIHPIDLLRYLFGEVDEVFSYANHIAWPEYPLDDCVMVMLKFRNGIIGRLMVAFGGKHPHYHPLVIYGSKGSLRTDELFLEKYETKDWIKLPNYTYDHTDNCIESISDFVDKVRNGGIPKANVIESAKAVAICEAAIESYQTGKPVTVSREFDMNSI